MAENRKSKNLPTWLSSSLILGGFGLLLWLERKSPLRRSAEPGFRRIGRNMAMAVLGGVALRIAEHPVSGPLSRFVERRRWGLLKIMPLPTWLEVPLAVALMDYTLYLWHVLAHRAPWLWRFHVPHHVDLDLDATTAVRFHFAELTLTVAWRVGQILLIGTSPLAISVWQTVLFLSVMFHHSNVALPVEVERRLNRFIVTPRMHGIHHSMVEAESNANWSSGLTIWDRLHGTLKLNVPQAEITIGVPAYPEPSDVTLPKIVTLPFREQWPSWEFPGDGRPERKPLPVTPPARLLP